VAATRTAGAAVRRIRRLCRGQDLAAGGPAPSSVPRSVSAAAGLTGRADGILMADQRRPARRAVPPAARRRSSRGRQGRPGPPRTSADAGTLSLRVREQVGNDPGDDAHRFCLHFLRAKKTGPATQPVIGLRLPGSGVRYSRYTIWRAAGRGRAGAGASGPCAHGRFRLTKWPRAGGARPAGQVGSARATWPVPPSTVTSSPVTSRVVAPASPITAGTPYSLASTVACDKIPDSSVTIPPS
jgi:hypothetical protein